MNISGQNQDVQGDLYEYLLSKLNTAGTNGQFRTPRHIIRMMVKMIDPRPGENICDPAAGTCGFLVNAWQHLLETHTDLTDMTYDVDGWPHGLTGAHLSPDEWDHAQKKGYTGYDNDSGMTMLRLGSMNQILHGIGSPRFRYADTLSKAFNEERRYDIVLANPPFKGAIDRTDVNPTLPTKVRKTEILFLYLFLRLLDNGGRAAVIVPDGILFGSAAAQVAIRRAIVEDNRLDAVISMPSGVFRPYAAVSTGVLLFTKGAGTEQVWFYEMGHDGFSLDDKRERVAQNDIPDLLASWSQRGDVEFGLRRRMRLTELRREIAPLKLELLEHQAAIHNLKFAEVISGDNDGARRARQEAEAELANLKARSDPLAHEINQLTRQFWVSKEQIVANNYQLSPDKFRYTEDEETFLEDPSLTVAKLKQLDDVARHDLSELETLLDKR
jgi:type I restriction enzyme M protein